ncbi:MAG: DMT family transporter [Planctomycetes bacterium]|nr:DMT family transporter [Planctomycetota bacterium]
MPRSEVPPADVNPAECSAVERAPAAAAKKLRPRGQVDPVLFGSGCGLMAAFIYTCSNTCLRQVAHCDPLWVATMKAGPTFAVAALILAVRVARQLPLLATPRLLVGLSVTGLIGQWLGNVGFQIGLKYVGLALSVPLTLGLTIIGGALLGRFWLNEPISRRSVLATLVLLIAVPILTAGAERSGPPEVSPTVSAFWLVAFGVVAACASGLA